MWVPSFSFLLVYTVCSLPGFCRMHICFGSVRSARRWGSVLLVTSHAQSWVDG